VDVAVIDVDKGWNRIMRDLNGLDGIEIVAGILKDAGTDSRGTPMVDIATYNEYGTRHIPSRPFVRIAADDNKKAWLDTVNKEVGAIIDGNGSKSQLGKQVGERMKKDIQDVIGDKSRLEPNAASTLARKKRLGHGDKPLIDTGHMKKIVNYRVED
jgi:hypothetical protein